jgi:hypothetical protein
VSTGSITIPFTHKLGEQHKNPGAAKPQPKKIIDHKGERKGDIVR